MEKVLTPIIQYITPVLIIAVLGWRFGQPILKTKFWALGRFVREDRLKFTKKERFIEFRSFLPLRFDIHDGNLRTIYFERWTHFRYAWLEWMFCTGKYARYLVSLFGLIIIFGLTSLLILISSDCVVKYSDFSMDAIKECPIPTILYLISAGIANICYLLALFLLISILVDTLKIFYNTVINPYYPLGRVYLLAENNRKSGNYKDAIKYYSILKRQVMIWSKITFAINDNTFVEIDKIGAKKWMEEINQLVKEQN